MLIRFVIAVCLVYLCFISTCTFLLLSNSIQEKLDVIGRFIP